ncbi:MAG: ClpXP protease specificity-enhancing factor SspB [Nitrospirota bacterium]
MSDNNDAMSKLNELKKTVFYELLNVMGRVFVIVRYSDDVQIGTRGFLKAEKENGLVLVFNSKMNFTWDKDGLIAANLVFGTKTEDCLIPVEHIIAVYSPELQTQFVTTYMTEVHATAVPSADAAPMPEMPEKPEGHEEDDPAPVAESDNKVLKVDFSKKKKK